MNANDLANAYLSLTPEEKTKARKLLEGQWRNEGTYRKGSEPQQEGAEGAEGRLYAAVAEEYKRRRGISLPPFGALVKEIKTSRLVLQEAVQWLTSAQELPRPTELALFRLAAEALVHELRWAGDPQGIPSTYARLTKLCESVDRSYPSYRANGLLILCAERAAEGRLPRDLTDQED